MKISSQIEHKLKEAGYEFVRRGKHILYKHKTSNHTITVPTSTNDSNAVKIIEGLIRRGKRRGS